jgi:hypothetical protein
VSSGGEHDRLGILISGDNSEKLLGVAKINDPTGSTQASKVFCSIILRIGNWKIIFMVWYLTPPLQIMGG